MAIPFQKEKIENAISYFAAEHKKRTHQALSQTALYKYLAFFDFGILKKTGSPALGLKYLAMDNGPVPIDIYKKRDNYKTELFEFRKVDNNKYIIISMRKADLDFFSELEIEELQRLIEIYANCFVDVSIMSDASHQEIRAWAIAYKKRKNSPIDYKDTFEDIDNKDSGRLSCAEEKYLLSKIIKKEA